MSHIIKSFKSDKLFIEKFGSIEAEVVMHPSQLSLIAHWRKLSKEPTSQGNLKLPCHGVSTKEDPEENQPRGLDHYQFENLDTGLSMPPGSKDKKRHGSAFVDVMPMLLQPEERVNFGRNGNVGRLFELVTRSQNNLSHSQDKPTVRYHSPASKWSCNSDYQQKMCQPQYADSSASNANLGPIVDPCQVSSDKTVEYSSVHKDPGLGVSPGECSSTHVGNMSSFGARRACEGESWRLALREGTGQELILAAKAPDVEFQHLANQPYQMEKPDLEKNHLVDAKLDKNELTEPTSGGLMHSVLMPFNPNVYEQKNRQVNCRETHMEKSTCIHSAFGENEHCQRGSRFTLADAGKKMNMVYRSLNQFICPSVGGFLCSSFVEAEGQIIQSFSEMEYFRPQRKKSQEPSKLLDRPRRIDLNATPTFFAHDGRTLRISATVDKVERVPGWGPSKFSKTTHSFLITKQSNMPPSMEDQLITRPFFYAESHQNAFLGMVDLWCNKEDLRNKFLSRSSRTYPLSEDLRACHFRSSGNAEPSSPSNHTRVSSPKSADCNVICTQSGGAKACFERPHAVLLSKGKFAAVTSSSDMENELSTWKDNLDLNAVLPRNSSKGLATDAIHKDSQEAETTCEGSQEMCPLVKETKGGNVETKMPSRVDDLHLCSDINGSVKKKEICSSRAHNLHAVLHQPICQSDFRDLDSDSDIRWIKRLKRNNSEAFGTKRSSAVDIFSEDIRTKLFKKAVDSHRPLSSIGLISNSCIKKQRQELAKKVAPPGRSKSAAEILEASRMILSNPWLRRLHPLQLMQTGSAEATCEPAECSKVASDMQGKGSSTSLGAMALLGKVMRNFRTCELRKKGSSVVWKTDGYL